MSDIVVVTGTDTGVGKTIGSAALAAMHQSTGGRVLMIKPVQTGADCEPIDAETVASLTGCASTTLVTLDEPLSPDTAARRAGVQLPTVVDHAQAISDLAHGYDTVIVEGAGGITVRLEPDGSLLDLITHLSGTAHCTSTVVVTRSGLGTLNHTALTVLALRQRDLEPAGLIVGAWPTDPGLADQCNVSDLTAHTGVPVIAVVPSGAASLSASEFRRAAPTWFRPSGFGDSYSGIGRS